MRKNINKIQKYFRNKNGFALLYSVVVSSIILAIALGVSNIAYKEIVFGTSAKDANDAFYAADTAAECTLYYDNSNLDTNFFGGGSNPPQFYCGGNLINISPQLVTTFVVSRLGDPLNPTGCAIVTVDKSNPLITKTTSVGYNNGGGILNSCTPNTTSVQRVLELNY